MNWWLIDLARDRRRTEVEAHLGHSGVIGRIL